MSDPLELSGFDPSALESLASEKALKKKAQKPPDPLQMAKEERMRQKEERLRQKEERLSRGATASAAEAAPPVMDAPDMPPPPVKDRSAMLDKIFAYRDRFPELRRRNKCDPSKASVEELEDELHYIEVQLGSSQGNGGNMGLQAFCAAMYGLELSTQHFNPLKLNLAGLGAVAKDNADQFLPILDELSIKYGAGMFVPPEMRLAIAVGTLVVTVHSANQGDPRLAQSLAKMGQPVSAPASASSL